MKIGSSSGLAVLSLALLAGGLAASVGAAALAQGGSPGSVLASAPDARAHQNARNLMATRIEIDINQGTELRDVFAFLGKQVKEQTRSDLVLEPLWRTDADGLDPSFQVPAMSFKNVSGVEFLEKVLAAYSEKPASWQLTALGAVQVGPKDVLNKFRRVVIYDINDLLFVMPVYNQSPEIDLDRILQGGGGRGGGGQQGSPFRNNNGNRQPTNPDPAGRAAEIIDLIKAYVEAEQWLLGVFPEPRYFQGHVIIEAPDYVHRGVNGYPWLGRVKSGAERPSRFVP